jgi:autoinducer 2-degrading protein
MHVVAVEFIAKPGDEERMRSRLMQHARDSLSNEEQCLVFDICVDPKNAARFFLYEVYENTAAFDHHAATDHLSSFRSDIADWVASKSISMYERI